MKYACLVYQEAAGAHGANRCSCPGEAREYREELRQNGYLLATAALQPVHAAVTVRVRHGKVSIVAGAQRSLTRICLIEARDLNDAIRLAARMPEARHGSIEVRPLAEESEP